MLDYLSLLTSIPSLMSNFSGSAQPYRKEQEQLAGRQNQISGALTDNNNPLYQQIYGQYKQQNQNNMGQYIAEAQGQNRMNANMGRTPLFSQERGSENIFRQLMQGYQNQGVQADQQTRQALSQAMGGAAQAGQSYNQLTPFRNMQTAQGLQGYKDIYSLLSGNSHPQQGGGYNSMSGQSNMMMAPQSAYVPSYNQTQQPQQQQQMMPMGYSY